DARLAEIEKYGQATAETEAKVENLNSAIDSLQQQLSQRVDDLENRLNRPLAGGFRGRQPNDEQLAVYARWQSYAQGRVVETGDVDLTLIDNYNRAFRDWMRRGEGADRESLRILNELSVSSDPDGGYLVSPDVS